MPTKFSIESAALAGEVKDERLKFLAAVRGAFRTLEAAIRAEDWQQVTHCSKTITKSARALKKLNSGR